MISVIVITKNEEAHIFDCLESVKWADEIIVVDNFSDDKTFEICKKFTSLVYLHDWQGFGIQKNRALSYATGEWVFSIDADERVDADLKNAILEAVYKNENCAYKVKRLNFFSGKAMRFGKWSKDRPLRLFKRCRGEFSLDKVHESVNCEDSQKVLSGYLHHYPYKNYESYIQKMQLYTSVWAQEQFSKGRKSSIFKAFLRAWFKFISSYIFRLGFLDGSIGFSVAYCSMIYTFFKYAKLHHFYQQDK